MRAVMSIIFVLAIALGTANAVAQSTRPASNLIQRATTAPAQAGAKSGSDSSIPRVALSLGAVLGLIVLMYWGTRKLAPRGAFGPASGAIRVLGRTHVSSRHRVAAILVGRRIIIVAEGPQQMSTLCEITEPDEVAALLGQLSGDAKGSLAAVIEASAAADSMPQSDQSPADPELSNTRQELAGLMQRVRGLASQIGRDRA